ncbi:MAG TPA: histidine kinase dimerization/phospho-acceptor domain-containing protein [Gaiellaceae bacterium]|nr:histidine kinase dimerization/phospho-acceptor domain-containing protein [Gaiellaceae bacterium]
MTTANDRRFAELVSVACHDILTPLATVYGFARTLEQLPLDDPAPRYLEMIGAASSQIDELVDQLRLVARIEAGRYEPALAERDSLELAREAAGRLEEGRVLVSGRGAPVRVDPDPTVRALAQLARAAARFGGHDSVSLAVAGAELTLSPLSRSALPVVLGEEARELAAPAAALLLRALGGDLEAREETLLIRLPTGS